MTDHGLLFKPHLAQATHGLIKTNTRRFPERLPPNGATRACCLSDGSWEWIGDPIEDCPFDESYGPVKTRFKAGDTFWVRETHYAYGHWYQDGLTKTGANKWLFERTGDIAFAPPSDGFFLKSRSHNQPEQDQWYKRNSLFLPRKYARTSGIITSVRVERLQDISEADAIAEGVEETQKGYWRDYGPQPLQYGTARESFRSLWDSINTKSATTWADNPWVVAINLEVK